MPGEVPERGHREGGREAGHVSAVVQHLIRSHVRLSSAAVRAVRFGRRPVSRPPQRTSKGRRARARQCAGAFCVQKHREAFGHPEGSSLQRSPRCPASELIAAIPMHARRRRHLAEERSGGSAKRPLHQKLTQLSLQTSSGAGGRADRRGAVAAWRPGRALRPQRRRARW